MPHIIVEYSANLEPQLDIRRLVKKIHEAGLGTGVMPIGGLRTRAERREIFCVADGDPDNAFIAILVRLGKGRSPEVRKRVAQELMSVLELETAEIFRSRGLGLTVEVREIDDTASLKTNNMHERVAHKRSA